MIKVDIFSGFLGAGKTTLIKKLIKEAYAGEKLVLIENEFGQIGIDGGFLREAGIEITEMNSGCICCSLVGDFGEALKKVAQTFSPDRIVIEPSGVGKLSDVINAVQNAEVDGLSLNAFTTVIDASKCKMYLKNFEEFYRNQIEFASSVILSRTAGISESKLEDVLALIKDINSTASIVTTPWDEIDGKLILSAMEKENTLEDELKRMMKEHHEHHHHHGHECDDPDCDCHEHHHDHECGHHEHHHHHDHECDDPDCDCHDHHRHHADDVFTSWGIETASLYTKEFVEDCLNGLESGKYGVILRAKGILRTEGGWINFDYVPGEISVRDGLADTTGKLCVIGSKLDKAAIEKLFTR